MKKTYTLILSLCLALSLSACDNTAAGIVNGTPDEAASAESAPVQPAAAESAAVSAGTEKVSGDAQITLKGSSAESGSGNVKISGSTVTITKKGKYVVSGTLDDGMIIIDADKSEKVELILNGAGIASSSSAAIYVRQADKLTVTLANGSVNKLSNGGSFTAIDDNNIDAAIFSKDDLTLDGSGTLAIISPAGHGIAAKDDLKIKGGSYVISAAGHGVSANDSIEAKNADFDITAGKDGFNCGGGKEQSGTITADGGVFRINAAGDGFSSDSTLTINAGTFDITCGGGSGRASDTSVSSKALRSSADIMITGGDFTINSSDDAVHSASCVTIEAGSLTIATGDDGIHADDTLTVCGGKINITESYEGLEGLNIDISGGDIRIASSDDGINAAGGNDQSGFGGKWGNDFFGKGGKFGGFGNGGRPDKDGSDQNLPQEPPSGGMSFGEPPSGEMPFGEPPSGEMPAAQPPTGEPPAVWQPSAGAPDENADGSEYCISISGGIIYINANGDGLDSNGIINISGGEIYVSGPTDSMNGAIDYERTGTITGGTVIAVGAAGMAQNFSYAEQGSIFVNTGRQEAGTAVKITDENGNVLAQYQPEKTYESVVISCPELKTGSTYTVSAGSFTQTISLDTEIYGEGFGGFGGFGGGGKKNRSGGENI